MDPSMADDYWGSMSDEEFDPLSNGDLKDHAHRVHAKKYTRIIKNKIQKEK